MSVRKTEQLLSIGKATYQGKRATQEDSFYVGPAIVGQPWFGVIADGMGGHQAGDVASQTGVQSIREFLLSGQASRRTVSETLRLAVGSAHQAVIHKAQGLGELGNMGSTIVAFGIASGTLYWCSAGDSRLYLIRGREIRQLTRDFTLGAELQAAVKGGHVSNDMVAANPQRGALTSFLGADNLRTDDGAIALAGGDFVIACTDGVYGTVGNAGLIEACVRPRISDGIGGEIVVDYLFKEILFPKQKQQQDNATAIVVGYDLNGLSSRGTSAGTKGKSTALKVVVAIALAIGLVGIGVALKRPLDELVNDFKSTKAPEIEPGSKKAKSAEKGVVQVEAPKGADTSADKKGAAEPAPATKPEELPTAVGTDRALIEQARDFLAKAKRADSDARVGLAEAALELAKKLAKSDDAAIRSEAKRIAAEAEKLRVAARRIVRIDKPGAAPEYTNVPAGKAGEAKKGSAPAAAAEDPAERERASRALADEPQPPRGPDGSATPAQKGVSKPAAEGPPAQSAPIPPPPPPVPVGGPSQTVDPARPSDRNSGSPRVPAETRPGARGEPAAKANPEAVGGPRALPAPSTVPSY